MLNRADEQSVPRLEARTGITVKNGIVERFPMVATGRSAWGSLRYGAEAVDIYERFAF
jgi:hypothetical protein